MKQSHIAAGFVALLALTVCTGLAADPLTEEDIAAFKIEDLKSSDFDTRMRAFRVIKQEGWERKYRNECVAAIKTMLSSADIMQKRTGIQGENLVQTGDTEIYRLVLKNAESSSYKTGNQNFYFQQSLIEYLVRELKKAKG